MSNAGEKKVRTYRRTLSIAGSDSGGGAGIQADLKTFSALGCYGMTVLTALTAQNTQGVRDIHPVPSSFVQAQLEAVLDDIGVDAVKIGMLFSAEVMQSVASVLTERNIKNIVLDPVMVAQSGDTLLEERAIEAMGQSLMPAADLITPNLPEAEVLLQQSIDGLEAMHQAVRELAAFGSRAVLLKGGHREGKESIDILYLRDEDRSVALSAEYISTVNNHGTGCTLSSAVAAHLACGLNMEEAVSRGKEYITQAIQAGANYRLGKGHGPVHHFFEFWK
ncbi:MAG: bifunctional hydroxymethylpyrimidine kinase/phosphomethylpyrimidine kinase [Thermodesulfobacteriota bacterium]